MASRALRAEGPGESRQPGSAPASGGAEVEGRKHPAGFARQRLGVTCPPPWGRSRPTGRVPLLALRAGSGNSHGGCLGRRWRERFLLHTDPETSRLYF